ncbi:MAG: penicillin-binding protein 2 [bacterium]|nr:penicillin-binding protein 2 [bacterium]
MFRRLKEVEKRGVQQRISSIVFLFIISFLILFLRLGFLQIVKGRYFRRISEENSIQFIPITNPRGLILDRNGEVLVKNRPCFNISFIQMGIQKDELERTTETLSQILNIDKVKLEERILEKRNRPFEPVLIAEDVKIEEVAKIGERKSDLPGVLIQAEPRREYIGREKGAHILGYLGKLSQSEWKELHGEGYRFSDLIGKQGVEKIYEKYLKGEDGWRQVVVDARGRILRELSFKEPVPGNNLFLTIDEKVQEVAEREMEGKQGAVVAICPKTGEVLALVSKPSFDPNIFICNPKETKELQNDPTHPLLNRAIRAGFEPGSSFKVVVAAAALEEEVISPSIRLSCRGRYYLGRHGFSCWKKKGHGVLNIEEAIIHSCNVFFYHLGKRLTAEKMAKYAKRFGLGKETGVDLPGEISGLVPSPKWKKEVRKEKWYAGEDINFAIGQGSLLVTPLQMANLACLVANRGEVYKPHIVKRIENLSFETIRSFKPEPLISISLSKETWDILYIGLKGVVEKGTGRRAFSQHFEVAGKTGTAQNPRGEDHAWFICFAPALDPKVAVSCLIEHGGKGGAVAAPIAKHVLEAALR